MKPLNCDQVFEVLTRGPFPTGDAIDAPVERHLGCCHECRALAEALRPAIELFHESIEPEESRDLPGYHGSVATRNCGLAQLVAEAIDADSPMIGPQVTRRQPTIWDRVRSYRPTQLEAFATAMVVGALFVLSLASFGATGGGSPPQAATFVPHQDGLMHLAALELRPACFTWSPGEATSSLSCCTNCHSSANKQALSARSIAMITANCRACHP
jgi:hypothetical protein